jgi:hypothetical protein
LDEKGEETKIRKESGDSFIGEFVGQAISAALAAFVFWFLSRPWSWWVFLIAGLALMFGIPLYFTLRRK